MSLFAHEPFFLETLQPRCGWYFCYTWFQSLTSNINCTRCTISPKRQEHKARVNPIYSHIRFNKHLKETSKVITVVNTYFLQEYRGFIPSLAQAFFKGVPSLNSIAFPLYVSFVICNSVDERENAVCIPENALTQLAIDAINTKRVVTLIIFVLNN